MHKELLEALKTKFEGVSEAILNRIATKLAKTVTSAEQVKTAVEGVTIQQVIESYGDSRATEAQQTAIHNYETKHGLKDGVRVVETPTGGAETVTHQTNAQPNNTSSGGAETVPAWAQALIESNKQLTERLNQVETERTTTSRKQQLSTVVSKLPENLRKPYERTAIDGLTDEQFNTLLSEITTEVDGITSSLSQKGVVFGRPTATGGTNNGTELSKEQMEAISQREGVVSEKGQPF